MKYQMILRNLGRNLGLILKKKGAASIIAGVGLIMLAIRFPGDSTAGQIKPEEVNVGIPFETLGSITDDSDKEELEGCAEDSIENGIDALELLEERKLECLKAYKRIVSNVRIELAESYIGEPIEIAADSLESIFGIKAYMYESFYGEKSTLENSYDTYLIIKSTEGNLDEVRNLLNDYISSLKATASLRDELKYRKAKVGEHNEYLILSVLGAKSVNNYKSVQEAEKEYSNFNKSAIEIGLLGVRDLDSKD